MRKQLILIIPLIITLVITLYFGLIAHVIGDASLYASISKYMFLNNSFEDLFLLGREYIQKPHLLFWLSTLSYHFFGVSTLSFKLPSVLIALSGVFGLFLTGKELKNKQVGLLSAFIWLFSLPMLLHLNDIHMDTMMSGFIIWTAFFWVKYFKTFRSLYFYLGCVFVSLAIMTKGPLGGFVPITGFLFAFITKNRLKQLFSVHHFIGAGLILLLITPIVYFIYNQHGINGVSFFFIGNNSSRINSGGSFFDKDFSFYIHTLLWFYLPWSLVGLLSLGYCIKDLFNKNLSLVKSFLLGSFSIFFIIASLADGHAPHYIFTLLPFLTLLTALELQSDKRTITKKVLLLIPTIVILVVSCLCLYLFPPKEILHYLGISCIVLFFIATFFIELPSKYKTVLSSGGGILFLFLTLNIEVFNNYVKEFDAPVNAIEYVDSNFNLEKIYFVGSDHDASRSEFYGNTPIDFFFYDKKIQLPEESLFYALVDKNGLKRFKELEPSLEIIEQFENLRMTVPINAFKKKMNKGYKPKYLYLVKVSTL